MSHYGIRAVNRSCGSYGPGHQVHWIQAKKSWEEGPEISVSKLVVHDDGLVDLEGHELKATMWNHDPGRLRDAVHYRGRGVWKPRFYVLAVPGPSGYLFKMFAVNQGGDITHQHIEMRLGQLLHRQAVLVCGAAR